MNKLVAFGVLVAEGSGKYSVYSLNRLCTINAPYAPSSVNVAENGLSAVENRRNKAKNGGLDEGITGHDAANDPINHTDDPINGTKIADGLYLEFLGSAWDHCQFLRHLIKTLDVGDLIIRFSEEIEDEE